MFRRSAVMATLFAFTLSVAACSADSTDDGDGAGAGTTAVVDDSPAPGVTEPSEGDGNSAGTVDCAAAEAAYGALIVNSQVVVQLANQPDVTQWSTIVGTMPEFAQQLQTLRSLEPFGVDVAEAIDFFAGANEIAQRGYGGDAAAAAELAAFVGPDVAAMLAKRTPIALAFDAAEC